MKFPTVDKAFFFFKLETGAYFLAGLTIFASLSIVSTSTTFLAQYVAFFYSLNESDQNFFRRVLVGKKMNESRKNHFVIFNFHFLSGAIVMYCVYVLYFLIVFVASIMLILGTRHVRMTNKICKTTIFKVFFSTFLFLAKSQRSFIVRHSHGHWRDCVVHSNFPAWILISGSIGACCCLQLLLLRLRLLALWSFQKRKAQTSTKRWSLLRKRSFVIDEKS